MPRTDPEIRGGARNSRAGDDRCSTACVDCETHLSLPCIGIRRPRRQAQPRKPSTAARSCVNAGIGGAVPGDRRRGGRERNVRNARPDLQISSDRRRPALPGRIAAEPGQPGVAVSQQTQPARRLRRTTPTSTREVATMGHMEQCRACKSDRLLLFLELGLHPPANRFLAADELGEEEPLFPLNAHVCLDCALIQVPDFIPPDFFRHYLYVPSASETMQEHFHELARTLAARFPATQTARVVDIGSNDGLFLAACLEAGVRPLGIEPARNLTEIARARGVEVVNEYFSPAMAARVKDEYGAAAVITTTNTFNHIDDLHGFVEGVRVLLAPEGVFVIEVPHAGDLVEKNEFDTIYHEHLSEFSVKSLADLLAFFDMEIFDIERLVIHGGSMRVYAQARGGPHARTPEVEAWLEREREARLFDPATYAAFAERVAEIRSGLLALCSELKASGHKLAGYGAPAKGNTLLNYYDIGPETLDFLVDRNPLKQGLYSPGKKIPVVPAERIAEERPDYLLILAWNFADEIMRQQEEFRRAGGKFILPIPEPRVVA
jgi:SAM-dependent methyltransferase